MPIDVNFYLTFVIKASEIVLDNNANSLVDFCLHLGT